MLGVLVWDGVSFLSLLLLVSVRSLSSVGLRLLGLYVDCSWEGCIIEELQQYGAVCGNGVWSRVWVTVPSNRSHKQGEGEAKVLLYQPNSLASFVCEGTLLSRLCASGCS